MYYRHSLIDGRISTAKSAYRQLTFRTDCRHGGQNAEEQPRILRVAQDDSGSFICKPC